MKLKSIAVVVVLFVSTQAWGSLVPTNETRQGRVTYDVGVSSGKSNDISYTEMNLGLNWWFHESFAWRNSFFGRFQTGVDNIYGLDTSIRGSHTVELGEESSMNLFLGPGWRFVNEGKNAPIAEGGLVMKLGGLSIGGGAKAVFNKVVDKTMEDDIQYFIILGGGGTL
jgi:hypothetical protein